MMRFGWWLVYTLARCAAVVAICWWAGPSWEALLMGVLMLACFALIDHSYEREREELRRRGGGWR